MDNRTSRILTVLRRWRFNYIGRRQLLALDNRSLKDIGISRADALDEGRKPFWEGGEIDAKKRDSSGADSNDMITENSHRAQC